MSQKPKKTKPEPKYVKNGVLLHGPRAENALFEAKVEKLRKELPPPVIPITLRMPPGSPTEQSLGEHLTTGSQSDNDAPDTSLKSGSSVSDDSDCSNDNSDDSDCSDDISDDSDCSDNECDGHRTLHQDTREAATESTTSSSLATDQEDCEDLLDTEDTPTRPDRVKKEVKAVDYKVLKQEVKKTDTENETGASMTAKGVVIKTGNKETVGVKKGASATADVSVTALKTEAANVKSTAISTNASAKVDVDAKGVSVKTACCDQTGVSVECDGSADVKVEAASANIGNQVIDGIKVTTKASVSAKAHGGTVEVGCVEARGLEAEVTAKASVEVSGANVQVGKVEAKGVTVGAKASALADAKGSEVQIGTLKATGVELKAEASVTTTTGTEFKVGNVNVSAFNGLGVNAVLDSTRGIRALNLEVGLNGQMGVEIAQGGLSIGNLVFRPGLPCFSTKRGLNLGFGGAVRGGGGSQGSAKGGKGAGSNNGSRTRSKSEGNHPGFGGNGSGSKGGTNPTSNDGGNDHSGGQGAGNTHSHEGAEKKELSESKRANKSSGVGGDNSGRSGRDQSYPSILAGTEWDTQDENVSTESAPERLMSEIYVSYQPAFKEVRRRNPASKGKAPPDRIPETLEEAEARVRRRIDKHNKEVEQIHQRDYEARDFYMPQQKTEEHQDEAKTQKTCTKDHVHTLKCYKNDGSKGTKCIRGSIHGFEE